MRTNRLAPPVLAFENTKPNTAKMTARNVDVDAESEGERGGREIANEYDPRDNLACLR